MKSKRSNSKRVPNRARSAGSHERLVIPRPTDEEISAKRDDACEAVIGATLVEDAKYKEGIRDALAWVLGDMEEGLEV